MLPGEIQKFIETFEKIPSIGPRQATRLAFYIIKKGQHTIEELDDSIENLKKIKICPQCFFIHNKKTNLCGICSDKSRNNCEFMILEKETDLISIEKTGVYKGRYLIMGELVRSGALEQWQKHRVNILKSVIEKDCDGKAEEIIIAFNPGTYGDLNTSLISKEFKDYTKKITKLGRGIPTGGEIEFSDIDTLSSSIKRREE